MAKGSSPSRGSSCVSTPRWSVNARLALVVLLASAMGCGCAEKPLPPTEKPRSSSSCERLPIPAFVTGANVIDHPDDKDGDPSNDGARGYGSERARRTLDRLKNLGLKGVVLSAPIFARDVRASEVRLGPLHSEAGLARLGRMIDDAHERGLVVTVVPHLLLDDGEWRGDLEPHVEGAARHDAIARFFQSYTAAIAPLVDVAEAHCAEAFSVAVELKSMSKDDDAVPHFRAMVKNARERFRGGLTYSANWDEVGTVRHWDLLDGIALNAFHPLTERQGAGPVELEAGARRIHEELLALRAKTGKPIWFMEVGFKAIPDPAIEPWLWPAQVADQALPVDEGAQASAYRAVASALRAVPAVDAAFFWAVPADPEDADHPWAFEPAQGFSFLGKAAEAVVQDLAQHPPPR